MKTESTFLGLIKKVVGANVLVEISHDIPSANPIINGRVYRLGQVGSFVRIPLGFLNVYGIVSMVGSSEVILTDTDFGDADKVPLPKGQRWIEVQLIGESYTGQPFNRGVSLFPTLDDEVHVVTEQDLAVIYTADSESQVAIGTYSSSESLTASLNLDKLVTRHAAIIGSTGSGKSNAVANLLKSLTAGTYPNAQVVIIDPHGEYAAAFEGKSRVFRIGDAQSPLIIPYWALSFDELAWFLVERKTASESLPDSTLRDYLFDLRKSAASKLKAGNVSETDITVDSPIPFDIKKFWHDLDYLENATFQNKEHTIAAIEEAGDYISLKATRFKPAAPGGAAPFKGQSRGLSSYLNKILGRLKDHRFDFLISPGQYDGITKDLGDLLQDWIGNEQSITIFDLAGVPSEVTDLVVGILTRILYESMFWGKDLPGIGRQRPLLICFEEAHSYLPKSSGQFIQGFARASVQRIFKEGRKYGIGSIVISQRPSELDETILSQCGTLISLRLSNSNDQSHVKNSVPDTFAGLIDVLPALRTGEALVLGEAVQIPSRVRIQLVEPRPTSNDPLVGLQWQQNRTPNVEYNKIVTGWRTQQLPKPK